MGKKEASPDRLTQQEKKILERLAAGLSDQQIAAELFLSSNTIRWYNRQIYSKLGVKNRTQAIHQARSLGLLEPEAPLPQHFENTLPSPNRLVRQQRVHFLKSFDGTRIAYALSGSGPPLVKTATFMSHLEAVVDAVGLRQFPLFAASQGGTVAVAYTVRHPERVSHLILYGAYARGWLNRDLTEQQKAEEKLLIDLMRVGWGKENPAFRQVFAMQLRPSATTEELRAFDELMRISTSSENAAQLESEMHRTDIRALAPLVGVPTLVVHPRGDAGVPFEEGRLLASLIPNAQFVALESNNHLLTGDEPAWTKFVDVFRSFLGRADT